MKLLTLDPPDWTSDDVGEILDHRIECFLFFLNTADFLVRIPQLIQKMKLKSVLEAGLGSHVLDLGGRVECLGQLKEGTELLYRVFLCASLPNLNKIIRELIGRNNSIHTCIKLRIRTRILAKLSRALFRPSFDFPDTSEVTELWSLSPSSPSSSSE